MKEEIFLSDGSSTDFAMGAVESLSFWTANIKGIPFLLDRLVLKGK